MEHFCLSALKWLSQWPSSPVAACVRLSKLQYKKHKQVSLNEAFNSPPPPMFQPYERSYLFTVNWVISISFFVFFFFFQSAKKKYRKELKFNNRIWSDNLLLNPPICATNNHNWHNYPIVVQYVALLLL